MKNFRQNQGTWHYTKHKDRRWSLNLYPSRIIMQIFLASEIQGSTMQYSLFLTLVLSSLCAVKPCPKPLKISMCFCWLNWFLDGALGYMTDCWKFSCRLFSEMVEIGMYLHEPLTHYNSLMLSAVGEVHFWGDAETSVTRRELLSCLAVTCLHTSVVFYADIYKRSTSKDKHHNIWRSVYSFFG